MNFIVVKHKYMTRYGDGRYGGTPGSMSYPFIGTTHRVITTLFGLIPIFFKRKFHSMVVEDDLFKETKRNNQLKSLTSKINIQRKYYTWHSGLDKYISKDDE